MHAACTLVSLPRVGPSDIEIETVQNHGRALHFCSRDFLEIKSTIPIPKVSDVKWRQPNEINLLRDLFATGYPRIFFLWNPNETACKILAYTPSTWHPCCITRPGQYILCRLRHLQHRSVKLIQAGILETMRHLYCFQIHDRRRSSFVSDYMLAICFEWAETTSWLGWRGFPQVGSLEWILST